MDVGLPHKIRFGNAAGELCLSTDNDKKPQYRMLPKGLDGENDLIRMAQLLSCEGLDPVLIARSRIWPTEKEYRYPVVLLKEVYTEALTEIRSLSVPADETDALLTNEHCTPV